MWRWALCAPDLTLESLESKLGLEIQLAIALFSLLRESGTQRKRTTDRRSCIMWKEAWNGEDQWIQNRNNEVSVKVFFLGVDTR